MKVPKQSKQFNRKPIYWKKKSKKTIVNNNVEISCLPTDVIKNIEKPTKIISTSKATSILKRKYFANLGINVNPTVLLFDYSILSDEDFRQMLLAVVDDNSKEHSSIKASLCNEENLTFIRQLAQCINRLQYLKLQHEQWSYYQDLGQTEGIWTGGISQKMATLNSICSSYGREEQLIEKRLKYFQEQIEHVKSQLNEHIKQMTPSCMDILECINFITKLVDGDQHPLRLELERRRNMLRYDAKDHQLFDVFTQLKPRQSEIHSAQIIWKTARIAENLNFELELFRTWLASRNSNTVLSCEIVDLPLSTIQQIFTQTTLERYYLSNVGQINDNGKEDSFKQSTALIIEQTLITAEEKLCQYTQEIQMQLDKILTNKEKFVKPPLVTEVYNAIENRRINMQQQAKYNQQQALKLLLS